MGKGELTHRFSIIVRRGLVSEYVGPDRMAVRARNNELNLRLDNGGCTMIQLGRPDGRERTYFYDKVSFREMMGSYFVLWAASIGVSSVYSLGLGNLAVQAALLSCFGSRGVVRRKTNLGDDYHDRIDYPISYATYQAVKRDLERPGTRGIYSLVYNNCASFSAATARRHGIPFPRAILQTPQSVARRIKKLARKQTGNNGFSASPLVP